MPLNKGKHIVEEINGVRCTIVETGATKGRLAFLEDLLTFNNFEVKVEELKKATEEAPVTYKIGVTDLVFNPMIAVYERGLRLRDGNRVSPAYWLQLSPVTNPSYWNFDHKQQEDGNLYISYRSV